MTHSVAAAHPPDQLPPRRSEAEPHWVGGVFRVAVPRVDAGLRENDQVTMGRADRQGDLFDDVVRFCEGSLPENSIYGFLARERDRLFPDELFDDLFEASGRRSVPPSVVATVMVLQRLGGLSDREAVDRYAFDVRWRYAAGVGGYGAGWGSFAHTVLVDMRAGLRSGDDDGGNGKPQIDWDDRAAREELSASRARDGFAVLALLDGREL